MRATRRHPSGPATTSPVLSLLLAATVALVAVLAVWDAGHTRAAAGVPAAVGAQSMASSDLRAEQQAPDPARVRTDAVDIDSPTIPLAKRDDDRLEVPEDAHTAGWWTGRANPGERGPAVIVGHVDSRSGPGAFWELADLEEGNRVTVDRVDGTSIHWRVDRVEQHPKDDFPTEAVYGDTDEPTLRLVTCSGFFDADARRYEDNTIVFLTLDAEQDPEVDRALAPSGSGTTGVPAEPVSGTADLPVEPGRAPRDLPTTRSNGAGVPMAEGPAPAEDPHLLRVLVAAVEPPGGSGERGVPIALAVTSLLLTTGAVWRELTLQR